MSKNISKNTISEEITNNTENNKDNSKADIKNISLDFTISQLLQAGAHYGHKKSRSNPKMQKYIYNYNTSGGNSKQYFKNNINIIDVRITYKKMKEALIFIRSHIAANHKSKILFVGTKKQASEAVKESAKRCGQFFVTNRWLGGMLTNFKTISKSIRKLNDIEKDLEDENTNLNKKEKLELSRQKAKLDSDLGGIRDMGGYPDILVIIDTKKESLAVKEAKKLGIPIVAIVDTNSDPDDADYPIPCNDDATKAISLYMHVISNGILRATQEKIKSLDITVDKNKLESKKEIEKKEIEKKEVKNKETKTKVENKAKKEIKPKSTTKKKVATTDKKITKTSEETSSKKSEKKKTADIKKTEK